MYMGTDPHHTLHTHPGQFVSHLGRLKGQLHGGWPARGLAGGVRRLSKFLVQIKGCRLMRQLRTGLILRSEERPRHRESASA